MNKSLAWVPKLYKILLKRSPAFFFKDSSIAFKNFAIRSKSITKKTGTKVATLGHHEKAQFSGFKG